MFMKVLDSQRCYLNVLVKMWDLKDTADLLPWPPAPSTPGLDPQVEPSSTAEELRLVLHIKEVEEEVRSKELEQEEVHLWVWALELEEKKLQCQHPLTSPHPPPVTGLWHWYLLFEKNCMKISCHRNKLRGIIRTVRVQQVYWLLFTVHLVQVCSLDQICSSSVSRITLLILDQLIPPKSCWVCCSGNRSTI